MVFWHNQQSASVGSIYTACFVKHIITSITFDPQSTVTANKPTNVQPAFICAALGKVEPQLSHAKCWRSVFKYQTVISCFCTYISGAVRAWFNHAGVFVQRYFQPAQFFLHRFSLVCVRRFGRQGWSRPFCWHVFRGYVYMHVDGVPLFTVPGACSLARHQVG